MVQVTWQKIPETVDAANIRDSDIAGILNATVYRIIIQGGTIAHPVSHTALHEKMTMATMRLRINIVHMDVMKSESLDPAEPASYQPELWYNL